MSLQQRGGAICHRYGKHGKRPRAVEDGVTVLLLRNQYILSRGRHALTIALD